MQRTLNQLNSPIVRCMYIKYQIQLWEQFIIKAKK